MLLCCQKYRAKSMDIYTDYYQDKLKDYGPFPHSLDPPIPKFPNPPIPNPQNPQSPFPKVANEIYLQYLQIC